MNTVPSSTQDSLHSLQLQLPFVPPPQGLQPQNQLPWDSSPLVALQVSLGTPCHRREGGHVPLPPENGGKCQCQPRRSASVLSPANTQHSGCHKDEGAHGPPQGPPRINTPNDKAPYTIAHEAHLLSTLL